MDSENTILQAMHYAINYSFDHVESCLKQKQNKHVLGIFIDTISHKLNNYGVRGNSLELIKSYLTNRLQYVSALGEKSDNYQ